MRKKSSDFPLVSVIMPVKDGSTFLVESVESILSQTCRSWELLVVDDHSTDSTPQIIEAYCRQHPRKVKLFRLKKSRGAYGAANLAMKYAKGKFIAPMDSDDVSHPERLKTEVEFLLNNLSVIVVGSHARIIDKNGRAIGKKVFPTGHEKISRAFFEVHPLVHPSCMIRREALSKPTRLYENKYGVNDDYYTFFTLLNKGKFANIPRYLLDYRIHLGNSSLQNIKSKFFNTVRIRFRAVRKHGYRPSPEGVIKLAAQAAVVSLIPEKVLLYLYLYIKGIYTLQDLFLRCLIRFDTVLVKARSFLPAFLVNSEKIGHPSK